MQDASINFPADLAQLDQALAEDASGRRTEAVVAFFDRMARLGEEELKKASNDLQRQQLARIIDGLRASQRIVRHVRETLHSGAATA